MSNLSAKEKATELVYKMDVIPDKCVLFLDKDEIFESTKKAALIAVEREYNSLREQLFNLRACGVIENENIYLKRVQDLIDEEKELKTEIEKL